MFITRSQPYFWWETSKINPAYRRGHLACHKKLQMRAACAAWPIQDYFGKVSNSHSLVSQKDLPTNACTVTSSFKIHTIWTTTPKTSRSQQTQVTAATVTWAIAWVNNTKEVNTSFVFSTSHTCLGALSLLRFDWFFLSTTPGFILTELLFQLF